MFKQLGVIWVVGLAVVFLTLLLGAGLVAGLLVWGVLWLRRR